MKNWRENIIYACVICLLSIFIGVVSEPSTCGSWVHVQRSQKLKVRHVKENHIITANWLEALTIK